MSGRRGSGVGKRQTSDQTLGIGRREKILAHVANKKFVKAFDIAQQFGMTQTAANQLLARYVDERLLERFDRGVYRITKIRR